MQKIFVDRSAGVQRLVAALAGEPAAVADLTRCTIHVQPSAGVHVYKIRRMTGGLKLLGGQVALHAALRQLDVVMATDTELHCGKTWVHGARRQRMAALTFHHADVSRVVELGDESRSRSSGHGRLHMATAAHLYLRQKVIFRSRAGGCPRVAARTRQI
jgi:hypothetical protein